MPEKAASGINNIRSFAKNTLDLCQHNYQNRRAGTTSSRLTFSNI